MSSTPGHRQWKFDWSYLAIGHRGSGLVNSSTSRSKGYRSFTEP